MDQHIASGRAHTPETAEKLVMLSGQTVEATAKCLSGQTGNSESKHAERRLPVQIDS